MKNQIQTPQELTVATMMSFEFTMRDSVDENYWTINYDGKSSLFSVIVHAEENHEFIFDFNAPFSARQWAVDETVKFGMLLANDLISKAFEQNC